MVTEACFSRRVKSKEPDHTGNRARERLDGLAKANSPRGYVIVNCREVWKYDRSGARKPTYFIGFADTRLP